LKPWLNVPGNFFCRVAPHTGACIETNRLGLSTIYEEVAPHVGA